MQIIIDDKYLDKLGIINFKDYREYIGSEIIDLLNARLAIKITEILSADQIDEFNLVKDEDKQDWLEKNIQNFEDTVKKELDEISEEINRLMPK